MSYATSTYEQYIAARALLAADQYIPPTLTLINADGWPFIRCDIQFDGERIFLILLYGRITRPTRLFPTEPQEVFVIKDQILLRESEPRQYSHQQIIVDYANMWIANNISTLIYQAVTHLKLQTDSLPLSDLLPFNWTILPVPTHWLIDEHTFIRAAIGDIVAFFDRVPYTTKLKDVTITLIDRDTFELSAIYLDYDPETPIVDRILLTQSSLLYSPQRPSVAQGSFLSNTQLIVDYINYFLRSNPEYRLYQLFSRRTLVLEKFNYDEN